MNHVEWEAKLISASLQADTVDELRTKMEAINLEYIRELEARNVSLWNTIKDHERKAESKDREISELTRNYEQMMAERNHVQGELDDLELRIQRKLEIDASYMTQADGLVKTNSEWASQAIGAMGEMKERHAISGPETLLGHFNGLPIIRDAIYQEYGWVRIPWGWVEEIKDMLPTDRKED